MKRILLPLGIVVVLIVGVFVLFIFLPIDWEKTIESLQQHSYKLAVFSIVLLVLDCILPTPSSLLVYANGLVLGWGLGFVISISSLMVSNALAYAIGQFFYKKASSIFNARENETAESYMRENGSLAIIGTRMVPILAESISFLSGNLRYHFGHFLMYNAIGLTPFCLLYGYLGFQSKQESLFLVCFAINIILATAIWWIGRLIRRNDNIQDH